MFLCISGCVKRVVTDFSAVYKIYDINSLDFCICVRTVRLRNFDHNNIVIFGVMGQPPKKYQTINRVFFLIVFRKYVFSINAHLFRAFKNTFFLYYLFFGEPKKQLTKMAIVESTHENTVWKNTSLVNLLHHKTAKKFVK